MHELSVTRSLVQLCQDHARGHRVIAVTLQIGCLAGVEPHAIEFCFEACSVGTVLQGASLIIERLPAKGECADCGSGFDYSRWATPCPSCGSLAVSCEGGDELRVKELEVE